MDISSDFPTNNMAKSKTESKRGGRQLHKLQPVSRKNCTPVFPLQCCDCNQLKLHINSYLQEYASDEPITIDLDTVLFHQTISGTHRGSIIHLLMVAKYTLYRSRFMTQNTPSTWFLILNMVLTLAKTLKLEQEQQMLHHVLNRMKLQINLS